nr:unnamed protein product [Callosobruchus chinensis]
MEEQIQAVSQALENQDQRISAIETSQKHAQNHVEEQLATTQKHVQVQLQQVKGHFTEMFRELGTSERNLTAVAPPIFDRHSSLVAKPYPYNGKTA